MSHVCVTWMISAELVFTVGTIYARLVIPGASWGSCTAHHGSYIFSIPRESDEGKFKVLSGCVYAAQLHMNQTKGKWGVENGELTMHWDDDAMCQLAQKTFEGE